MKGFLKYLYLIFSIIFLLYLAIPNQNFPDNSSLSLKSQEPADVESEIRRGYYNNETREDVINYYRNSFEEISVLGVDFKIPSLRLNYPPEESQTIIRDQTRSTYLEEIVHPLRGSLFISGFEPKHDKDKIVVNGDVYKQKIIIKMINSNPILRMFIGCLILLSVYINYFMWRELFMKYKKIIYEK